jgi:putative tricarboxylic transport membrane protein
MVWALIASLYIGNVMLLVLNLPLVKIWVKVLQIPRPYLYAGILLFAALGTYAVNFVVDDLIVLLIIGVIGFFMRRHGYPVAPLVVGLILGPMAEEQVRRTLQISEGSLSALVTSPFAAVAYGILIVLLTVAVVLRLRRKKSDVTV